MEEDLIKAPSSICSFCTREINTTDIYCQHCGYPENGEQLARFSFARKDASKRRRNARANEEIKTTRSLLYILSSLVFLYGLVFHIRIGDMAILITNTILASILVILGFWSKREPLMALLMGLFLYITLILVSLIINPQGIYFGILWKIFVLFFLIKGIKAALKLTPTNTFTTPKIRNF